LKSLEHIEKLIERLSQSSLEDYNTILKKFDFSAISFKPFESWSPKSYTRNCIYRDAHFELIVICWERGQETAIHGHDGEDCWVYLLEGEMEEVYFSTDTNKPLQEISSRKIIPQQLTFMNDTMGFHRLKNSNGGKSVSLHVYAKPIEHCVYYDENSKQFLKKTLTYDSLKEPALKY